MNIEPEKPFQLPLFPLNTVLFPTTQLPLRIFEPRYVDLIGRCMRDGSGFGVVAIRRGNETGRPAETYETGTVARIVDFDQGADGLLNITIRGEQRFSLQSTSAQSDNLLIGTVAILPDVAASPIPDDYDGLASLLADISSNTEITDVPYPEPSCTPELVYGLAQYLPLSASTKVALLEINQPDDLLERLSENIEYLRESAHQSSGE